MTPVDLIRLFIVVAASAQFVGIAIVLVRQMLIPTRREGERPPISVIRPVCGLDNYVEETLASTFTIDYPRYEAVFCVASGEDPVIPLVNRLMAAHPDVPSRLLVGDDRISINPKLNNVVKGWRDARHRFIVMFDSNVLLPADCLDQLLARWGDEDTGMVCSPPSGTLPANPGAELESAFLNTYQARWQFIADALGTAFAQGKAMFCRRDILDDAGGIEALAAQPAEDAAATKIVRARGLKVRLVTRSFPQPLGHRAFTEVWNRQVRWARLRRDTFKVWFALEILPGGFLPLLAAGILAITGDLAWEWAVLLAAAWYGAEALLAYASRWPISPRIFAALIARDLLLPALWVTAWSGSTFVWRGNAMDMRTAKPAPTSRFRGAFRLQPVRPGGGNERATMRDFLRRLKSPKEIG